MNPETITDVFFDLDHTLWDFEKNSALTFEKIFNEIGTLDPNKDNIPKENAISVAEGIAQPCNVSELPRFIET